MIPLLNFNYLTPMLYDGPRVFLSAVLNGINSNLEILFLSFCAPFLKTGTKTGKLFTRWNIYSTLLILTVELLTVLVMGPFAAKQNYPLATLAIQISGWRI